MLQSLSNNFSVSLHTVTKRLPADWDRNGTARSQLLQWEKGMYSMKYLKPLKWPLAPAITSFSPPSIRLLQNLVSTDIKDIP